MRATTANAWPGFISAWEGRVPFLYLDTKKLATFGLGIMVDTGTAMTEFGQSQPWRKKSGQLASRAEIRDEYDRIHAREDLAPRGGFAFRAVATLRLDETVIDDTLGQKTAQFWDRISLDLPYLEDWPADAQLALANMMWNLGPRFLGPRWPKFTEAAKAGDFAGCAASCVRAVRAPRDFRNRLLFLTAAAVIGIRGHPDLLRSFPGLSADALRRSPPDKRGTVAWITQSMLAATGDYDDVPDGLFGRTSQRALDAFADRVGHSEGLSPSLLKRLAQEADLTVPVVA